MLRPGAIFHDGKIASDSKRTIRLLLALTDYNLFQKNTFQITYTLYLKKNQRTNKNCLFVLKIPKGNHSVQFRFLVKHYK